MMTMEQADVQQKNAVTKFITARHFQCWNSSLAVLHCSRRILCHDPGHVNGVHLWEDWKSFLDDVLHTAVINANINCAEACILTNRRVTTCEITDHAGIFNGFCGNNHSCASCVQNYLPDGCQNNWTWTKRTSRKSCEAHLQHYKEQGHYFIQRTVICDEAWTHNQTLKSKCVMTMEVSNFTNSKRIQESTFCK